MNKAFKGRHCMTLHQKTMYNRKCASTYSETGYLLNIRYKSNRHNFSICQCSAQILSMISITFHKSIFVTLLFLLLGGVGWGGVGWGGVGWGVGWGWGVGVGVGGGWGWGSAGGGWGEVSGWGVGLEWSPGGCGLDDVFRPDSLCVLVRMLGTSFAIPN